MQHQHLLPGFAMDLTTTKPKTGAQWDNSQEETRETARKAIRRQRPYLLIGSPMCSAFSTWQALDRVKSSDLAASQKERGKVSMLHTCPTKDLESVAAGIAEFEAKIK